MWQGARVFKNWFFHPLHWPWAMIAVLIGTYLFSTGALFLLQRKEQNNKSHTLYYRALDIRKRELANLKLSGVEPYVWRPLFECKSLESEGSLGQDVKAVGESASQKETSPSQNLNSPEGQAAASQTKPEKAQKEPESALNNTDDPQQSECIQTAFAFSPSTSQMGYRPAPGKEEGVLYTEPVAPPCLICHPKKKGHTLTWSFRYPYVEPERAVTDLWKSYDFIYFHLIFWLFWFSYGLARLINRRSGSGDHIAAAIKVDEAGLLDGWLDSKEGKSFFRNFFYAEQGPQYVRGYIPRKRLESMLKKMSSGQIPVEASRLRIGVIEYGRGKLSFEGLRVAQALANKAPAGALVIEENIMPPAQEGALKKAIWKKGETPVYFRIMEL